MAKIDFTKVEEQLMNAMRTVFVKKIEAGKPVVSKRAIDFFRLDEPRPKTEDVIFRAIKEMEEAEEQILQELELQRQQAAEKTGETITQLPLEPEVIPPSQSPQSQNTEVKEIPVKDTAVKELPIEQDENLKIDPWLLLKKHLEWLRKQKVKDMFKLLETSRDEISSLHKKEHFDDADVLRIEELLVKSIDLKHQTMKKLGLDVDDTLVEKQRKEHIYKRFNIRENWLPLD